ncbi:MAG: sensor histidine kinase [Christensenellaceae bacterium]
MKANKNRIKELLLNLCDNAIKYNVRGGMVEVQLSQDEGYAVIKVKDSGIGIPKDEQNRIFERFYRAKNAGGATTSGTGLGLAIVKHIATLYDGEISLASVQEKGSEFTVKLKKQ